MPLLPLHAAKKLRVVSGVVSDAASGAVSGAVSGTITEQEEPELVMAISAPMAEAMVVVTAGETAAGEAMAEAMVEGAMAAAVKAVELVKAVSVSMAASMKGEAVKAVEMVVVTAGETAGETSLPLYAASTPMPLSRQELEIVQRHCDAASALKQLHGAPDFTHQEKERLYVRVHSCFTAAAFKAVEALPPNADVSTWGDIRFEAIMEAAEELDPHAHHVGMIMAYKEIVDAGLVPPPPIRPAPKALQTRFHPGDDEEPADDSGLNSARDQDQVEHYEDEEATTMPSGSLIEMELPQEAVSDAHGQAPDVGTSQGHADRAGEDGVIGLAPEVVEMDQGSEEAEVKTDKGAGRTEEVGAKLTAKRPCTRSSAALAQHAEEQQQQRSSRPRTRSQPPPLEKPPPKFAVFETVFCIEGIAGHSHTSTKKGAMVVSVTADNLYQVAFLATGQVSHNVREVDLVRALPHRGPLRGPNLPGKDELQRGARAAAETFLGRTVDWDAAGTLTPQREAAEPCAPCPESATACGGHILFPSCTTAKGKALVLPMGPDDFIHFLGTKLGSEGSPVSLTHGTLKHHPLEERASECKAHVSIVAQHDCAALGMTIKQSSQLAKDAQLLVQADVKAQGSYWDGAAIIEVEWDEGYWPLGNKTRRDKGPISDLAFDPGTMDLVSSRKTVVLDKSTKLPIILYSMGGAPQVGLAMRSHLEPLNRMPQDRKFNLSRTRDGLGTEAGGTEQRMNQIGTRRCDFNVVPSKRPTCRRGKLEEHVINTDGVLDLYADTYDEFDYWYNEEMVRMFGEMAAVIREAMPISSVYVAALQQRMDEERRCFMDLGMYLEPSRVLGENMGVSSAYCASLHNDPTDLLFVTAFAGKCGRVRTCGCGGCADHLFKPTPNTWVRGRLFHGGVAKP